MAMGAVRLVGAVILVAGAIVGVDRGYGALGVPGPWAAVLTAVHLIAALAVIVHAARVLRWAAANPPPPFLPEEELRILGRRTATHRWAIFVAVLSCLAVTVVGFG